MMTQPGVDQLITDVDANEFFRQHLQDAASNQQLTITPETIIYLSNMLVVFMRSEHLFREEEDGTFIRPLAMQYIDAVDAESTAERNRLMQQLGDVALFVSGMYAASLGRSLVDLDYYAAMGGSAYAYLAEIRTQHRSCSALQDVFYELAQGFMNLIDLLWEVGENTNMVNNLDLLRLYEIWLSTGSDKAAARLKANGILPVITSKNSH